MHQIHRFSSVLRYAFPKAVSLLSISHDVDDAVLWTLHADENKDNDEGEHNNSDHRYDDDVLMNTRICIETNDRQTVQISRTRSPNSLNVMH